MKKNNQFNVGDKVFAKVKGYPPWPAKIIADNGKKYGVEFYGTGETGNIKAEDIFYYLKHKEKFQKPLKRKDYVDAFEQIEEAIKKDGGDGNPSPDDSVADISLNSTTTSIDTPVKGKKPVKRKRSVSEKDSPESAQTPKKMGRPKRGTEVVDAVTDGKEEEIQADTPNKQNATPVKKSPRIRKDKEEIPKPEEKNEDESEKKDKVAERRSTSKRVPEKKEKVIEKKEKVEEKDKVEEKKEKNAQSKEKKVANDEVANDKDADDDTKTNDKRPDEGETVVMEVEENEVVEEKEKSPVEMIDERIEVVSEKYLKNNIAYAKYVKESESYYKVKPVEPRDDFPNQVLAVKPPTSEEIGGLKLHLEWPLKFDNEYERALYDESVALRVLDAKLKIASGDQTILNDSKAFIKNIDMTADAVKKAIYVKDLDKKKARIARLKIEAELTGLDAKIKNCLGLDKADPKEALGHLEAMCDIEFDDIMLKKHTHIVEVVRRLRKYVGNTKEWNMSEESLNEFSKWAEKVRAKAESVYTKFKDVMKLPDNCSSFWDGFMEAVNKFRADCKDLNDTQIFVLCAEPRSRRAYLDRMDEMESEKQENSNGGANNNESEAATVNGTTETNVTA